MKFDELCDAVVIRFEDAIKNPDTLNNMSPADAFLLGCAMMCNRMHNIEIALQDLTVAVGTGQPAASLLPSEPPGEVLRSADAMARGSRNAEPLVRVEAIPPGEGPAGAR